MAFAYLSNNIVPHHFYLIANSRYIIITIPLIISETNLSEIHIDIDNIQREIINIIGEISH